MSKASRLASFVALLAWCLAATSPAAAQYFGRNKVQYDDFDFKILRTDHFDVYFYPPERTAVEDASRMAERWYQRHSRTFLREFQERKPIIFYANDADFQQTNIISGQIGQGTGGVTESLKERVVMPLTGIYDETNHVLGHELVHSFQYDIALNRRDSTNFRMQNLPLWLVEGMAEYLSVGRVDPHTAMWLRDAAMREDLPTIEQLSRGQEYFPYRYGQAYMAYIGGKYGDASVANIYKLSGRTGPDSAIAYTLNIRPDSLSEEWIQSVRNTYLPLMEGRTPPSEAGRPLLTEKRTGGRINISPAISPNGRYVAFLSERDIFNINLFIADTQTGEVVEELQGPAADPHFDALRFINSAGTWSPDGNRFAFIAFDEGDNEIAIWNVEEGEITRRFSVQNVTAMRNPSWSPDGQSIAFSGMDGGISDLYVLDLQSRNVRQLTDDRYADLQPTWSPDGRRLAFVTDRGIGGTNFETLNFSKGRLGIYDLGTGDIRVIRPFGDALHHNPQFSPDGSDLYFISNYDGFKDIYRYDLSTEQTYRITRIKTGVSGITESSPAMTVSRETGEMVFSVYADNAYEVFALSQEELEGEPAEQLGEEIATAAVLPPIRPPEAGLVGSYLNDPTTGLPEEVSQNVRDYEARLRLDRVAPPSVGVSVGGPLGTGFAGGVAFLFSDMLGNHSLTTVVQANGTFKDIGGQVTYLNRDNRFNYGVSASHIPVRQVYYQPAGPFTYNRIIQRIYISNATTAAWYPLSRTRRFEVNAGVERYGFGLEVQPVTLGGRVGERQNLDDMEGDAIYFFSGGGAFVGDYSYMGFTSPMQGGRYRFEVSPRVGTYTFVQGLFDYRRYFFFNPLTVAVRGLHIGKYGIDRDQQDGSQGRFGASLRRAFSTLYLDNPYYQGFVRGYDYNTFNAQECPAFNCFGNLQGTRIALASLELRVPLLGTSQLGLFNFPYLPTELALFGDGGVAWTSDDAPDLTLSGNILENRVPVFSAGLAARFNLLGYIIVETYYAYPFQRPGNGGHLGFVLRPGW